MRRFLVLLLLCLCGACASPRTVEGTFPPATPTPATPTPAPTPIIVFGTKLFHTPSGNIGCVITKEGTPLFARCDIASHTWKAPKKPKDCDLDYANGVSVEDGKKGTFTCAGDTVLHQGDEMRYGQTLRIGVLVCGVAKAGVTCQNEASRHGFFLSKTRVRLF